LLNQKSDNELAYFNATQLAKIFNVKYRDITRGKNWADYVELIDIELNEQFCSFKNPQKAIIQKRGKYGGTWLHHDLAIEFVGLLNVKWKRELHIFMKNLIRHTTVLKVSRENTKVLFHPLTDVIKDVWIPAQESENSKKWAYSLLLDLANIKALGVSSRQYKTLNDITNEQIKADGNISIRDYMSKEELKKIEIAEQDIWGLIKYAKILIYENLKNQLITEK